MLLYIYLAYTVYSAYSYPLSLYLKLCLEFSVRPPSQDKHVFTLFTCLSSNNILRQDHRAALK